MNSRRNKATESFWSLRKIWLSKYITLKQKVKIFKATCIPIFLYGSETWIINDKMKNKINAFATKSYRYMLGVSKLERIKNTEILKTVKEKELIKNVFNRQNNFINKNLYTDNNGIVNKYLMYEPTFGKMKRGASSKLYSKYIQSILVNPVDINNNSLR